MRHCVLALLLSAIALSSLVSNDAESFIYSPSVAITTLNRKMNKMVPTEGFTDFSITPELPNGITIDEEGIISGTPIVSLLPTEFTVFAKSSSGSTVCTTITITVRCPNMEYTPDSEVIALNKGMRRMIPPYPYTEFTIEPQLPDGIELRYDGSILGTPHVLLPVTEFTVRAKNGKGVMEWTNITLSVVDKPEPLKYYPSTSVVYVNQAMFPMTPTPDYHNFTITPQLPLGLVLEENGIISGTPLVEMKQTDFTVIAYDREDEKKSAVVTITVIDSFHYDRSRIVITTHVPYPPLEPSASLEHYIVSPELPEDIHIDEESGCIGGIPSKPSPTTVYTITAMMGGTEVSTTVEITIIEDSIPLKYKPCILVMALKDRKKTMVPNANFTNFSIFPSLPQGITLLESGTIESVPKQSMPRTLYTVTAVHSSGEIRSATIAITIMERKFLGAVAHPNYGIVFVVAATVLVVLALVVRLVKPKESPLLSQV